MNCRCAAFGLSLLGWLSLVPGLAKCSEPGVRPLQLRLAAAPTQARDQARAELHATAAHLTSSAGRRAPRFEQTEPSLGQRALQSVLTAPEPDRGEGTGQTGQASARFRFERQGTAFRDVSRGYRDMCATLSDRIWDEPNGRRIKFDSAGKPGVAVVIPIR